MSDAIEALRDYDKDLTVKQRAAVAWEIERLHGLLRWVWDGDHNAKCCVCRDCTLNRANLRKILNTADQPALARGCHRSHPHENMDAGCERLTEIARENNRLANQPNQHTGPTTADKPGEVPPTTEAKT